MKIIRKLLVAEWTQNLSFLKRKSAAACFSVPVSGAKYLNAIIVIIYLSRGGLKENNLPGLHNLLDLSFHGFSRFWVAHLLICDDILEFQVILNYKTGWHEVVVVYILNKWFQSALSIKFLGAHLLCDFSGIAFNTNNESVTKLLVLSWNETESELTFLPSSVCLTMTAFLPACLPQVRITTLPFFIL